MGITSRSKRPLDRTIPSLRDTSLIIIACEGEKTEKQYFSSTIFKHHKIQIKILETNNGKSSPTHVHNRLIVFANETELKSTDQLWLVIDRDNWTDAMLSRVHSESIRGRLSPSIALSNPSFELWLLLHLKEILGESISTRDVEQSLREALGGYNKSNINLEKFNNNVLNAISRAKILDVNPSHRWPANPGTRVYLLVESIMKMIGTVGD